MRSKSVFRRFCAAPIVLSAILGLSACETTPPPVSEKASPPPAAAPEVAAAPEKPATVAASPAAPVEVPEKPTFVPFSASPASTEPSPIAEEPENPFAENDAFPLTPVEKAVTLSDIPLPAAPVLPEEVRAAPVPVSPAPVVPAAAKAAEKTTERPSVSTPVAPPAAPTKTPVAKSVPPKPVKPQSEPKKETPAVAKEPVVMPATSLPDLPSRAIPVAEEEKVDFSRAVRVMAGQLLEIPYRGAGWIFLGEKSAKKGLPYDSRRLDKDGQSFMFRAEEPGTFVLKFYRQDFVNDYIVNDFVQVTVEPSPAATVIGGFSSPVDRGRVVAEPRWPPAADASAAAVPAASSAPTAPASSSVPAAVAAPAAIVPAAVVPAVTPSPTAVASSVAAAKSTIAAAASSIAGDEAAASVLATLLGAPSSAAASAKTPPASTAAATRAAPPAPAAPAAPIAPAGVPIAPTANASGPQAASVPAGRSDSGIERERSVAPAAAVVKTPVPPAVDPASIAATASIDEFLSIAKKEAEYGRTANALAVLDRSRQLYPAGSDETWWQYGRLLESNGPTKDVKSSLAYYRRLIAEYPQSSRYDEARKRVSYLERYYFEIR